jgi:hypothetical protein
MLISGSITLNGITRVEVKSDKITASCRVIIKGASGQLNGTIVISEMRPGVGFGLSSTDPRDTFVVYFDVLE